MCNSHAARTSRLHASEVSLAPSQLMVGPTSLVRSVMRSVNMRVQCTDLGQYAGRYGPRTLLLINRMYLYRAVSTCRAHVRLSSRAALLGRGSAFHEEGYARSSCIHTAAGSAGASWVRSSESLCRMAATTALDRHTLVARHRP